LLALIPVCLLPRLRPAAFAAMLPADAGEVKMMPIRAGTHKKVSLVFIY
jgi:hypothetical protein